MGQSIYNKDKLKDVPSGSTYKSSYEECYKIYLRQDNISANLNNQIIGKLLKSPEKICTSGHLTYKNSGTVPQ